MKQAIEDQHISELISTSMGIDSVEDWDPNHLTITHEYFSIGVDNLPTGELSISCSSLEAEYKIEFKSTEELKDYILHADKLPWWAYRLPIDLRRMKYIPGYDHEVYMLDDSLRIEPFDYGCEYEPMETGFNLSLDGFSFSVMNEESLRDAIMLLTRNK